jgi:hypothetical protein
MTLYEYYILYYIILPGLSLNAFNTRLNTMWDGEVFPVWRTLGNPAIDNLKSAAIRYYFVYCLLACVIYVCGGGEVGGEGVMRIAFLSVNI